MRYRINEIFYSLQGEGFHTGIPSVFVRFSGCNLECRFCDTLHAPGTMLTLEEIAEAVNRHPEAPWVVLTGGEPSLFIDADFVQRLKDATGKQIAIETNGTRPLPDCLDWVTLSPKTGFRGGDVHPCVLTRCDELKVVYLRQKLDAYAHIQASHRFLQPCFVTDPKKCAANVNACVIAVLTHPGWRLSLQTHRLLHIK
ncbi:MAG: 7-carboxy-7-deazaguanine synthase QueE [Sodaliphilus sp.]